MKKILITGVNSYVGTSFEKWLSKPVHQGKYEVKTLDMKDEVWKNFDFSSYDAIFHVAGIAHVDVWKVNEDGKKLYYQVNRDLAISTAKKYKKERGDQLSQFIYMSSLIVYEEASDHKKYLITKNTKPNPLNFYGDSKLQAEKGLQPLETSSFRIAILRPPMIYGPKSKGNYPRLAKLAQVLPVFSDIRNERSMLYVYNLTEFVRQLIDSQRGGLFFPQNKEYVRTSQMVQEIAKAHGKKIHLFSWANGLIKLFSYIPGPIGKMLQKAFGNLVCAKELSEDFVLPVDFVQSIQETELE